MAYLPAPQTEEEKQREEQMRAASGMPGGPGAAMPAGAQPSPTSGQSGNYTNVQRYLEENRSQAGDLANKVAGQVTAAGEEAKTAAEQLAARGKEAVEAARVPVNQGVLDETAASPTGVLSDAEKKAAFERQRDAAYGGPESLEDVEGFQDAQDKVRKAQERIGLTETEPGRVTLLQEMGGPGYGRGKASLNQLLLSGSPEAAESLKAATDPYRGLQDYLSGQDTETRTAAQKAIEEAGGTRKAVQDRFLGAGGVVEQNTADLLAKLEAAKSGGSAEATAAAEALAKWQPTDQDLATLGLTREDYNGLQFYKDSTLGAVAPDIKQYFSSKLPDTEFSMANVASLDDYAREAALEELLGTYIPTLAPEDIGLAGTAPESLASYDLTGAKTGVKAAFKDYLEKPLDGVQKALAINPNNTMGMQPYNGLPQARSMQQLMGGNFYDSLVNMGKLYALYDQVNHLLDFVTPLTPGYIIESVKATKPQWEKVREALAPVVESPLFAAGYKAAKEARAKQIPGTSPDALVNHLPPEFAAMFK